MLRSPEKTAFWNKYSKNLHSSFFFTVKHIISYYYTIKEKGHVYNAHLYSHNPSRKINTSYVNSRDKYSMRILIALYCDIISNNSQELVHNVLAFSKWRVREMQSK